MESTCTQGWFSVTLRRVVPIVVLLSVAGLGGVAVRQAMHAETDRKAHFGAHEFALFRSSYEAIRVQTVPARVEHFHKLVEASESASLTPGMIDNLSEFCRVVLASEEVPEIKEQAKTALRALERRVTFNKTRLRGVAAASKN
jgi:hypothetical protein